tara:strand:- start:1399 stop:1731 length:333 start_codon:yes stop_codon:yes gene_type:complete
MGFEKRVYTKENTTVISTSWIRRNIIPTYIQDNNQIVVSDVNMTYEEQIAIIKEGIEYVDSLFNITDANFTDKDSPMYISKRDVSQAKRERSTLISLLDALETNIMWQKL